MVLERADGIVEFISCDLDCGFMVGLICFSIYWRFIKDVIIRVNLVCCEVELINLVFLGILWYWY